MSARRRPRPPRSCTHLPYATRRFLDVATGGHHSRRRLERGSRHWRRPRAHRGEVAECVVRGETPTAAPLRAGWPLVPSPGPRPAHVRLLVRPARRVLVLARTVEGLVLQRLLRRARCLRRSATATSPVTACVGVCAAGRLVRHDVLATRGERGNNKRTDRRLVRPFSHDSRPLVPWLATAGPQSPLSCPTGDA